MAAWVFAVTLSLFLESMLPSIFVTNVQGSGLVDALVIRNSLPAYLALGFAFTGLALAYDHFEVKGAVMGTLYGAIFGTVASMAVISRSLPVGEEGWMLLLSTSLIHLIQFGCAGACLGAYRST